jgi:hypothetical protein
VKERINYTLIKETPKMLAKMVEAKLGQGSCKITRDPKVLCRRLLGQNISYVLKIYFKDI